MVVVVLVVVSLWVEDEEPKWDEGTAGTLPGASSRRQGRRVLDGCKRAMDTSNTHKIGSAGLKMRPLTRFHACLNRLRKGRDMTINRL